MAISGGEIFTAEILTAVGGFIAVIGGGIRWLVVRIDAKTLAIEQRQDRLNGEFRKALELRIDELVRRNAELEAHLDAYLRHVGRLEGIMQAQGLSVPAMEIPRVQH